MNRLSGSSGECVLESDVPTDCISRVRFAPNSDELLLSTSWDGYVRFHNVASDAIVSKYKNDMNGNAVLDAAWEDSSSVCAGGLGYSVVYHNVEAGTSKELGQHDDAIRCVEYSSQHNCFLTGGWDSQLKIWDWRANRCVGSFMQDGKVYSMSLAAEKVVVAQRNRKVWIWDLRQMHSALQKRDSPLKYQTRYVECFPDGRGYIIASIEGRVALDYFEDDSQYQKYAFKCHRIKGTDGMEQVYPVNAIAFHKQHGTFATGGSDGFTNIWDGVNKKRLCQLRKFPTSISSLSFSDSGQHIAIASSYLFEMGDQSEMSLKPPPDAIYIKKMSDQETCPKK